MVVFYKTTITAVVKLDYYSETSMKFPHTIAHSLASGDCSYGRCERWLRKIQTSFTASI